MNPVMRVFTIPMGELRGITYDQLTRPGCLLVSGLGGPPVVIDIAVDVLTFRGVQAGHFIVEHTPGGAVEA